MDRAKRDIFILKKNAKYCEEIAEAHKYFGNSLEEFQNNQHYFKSVAMSLLQIGELANHLSKDFQKKHKDIEYAAIIGLRNIVAHGYDSLDWQKIWKISQEDAPALQNQCLEILAENALKNNETN